MLSNFKLTFKILNMNGKLWKTIRVGNAAGSHEAMESIKEDSVDNHIRTLSVDHNNSQHHMNSSRNIADICSQIVSNSQPPIMKYITFTNSSLVFWIVFDNFN
ncbi:hypothetical protein ACOSQ4_009519 [Xanthoceras sorbifolium]